MIATQRQQEEPYRHRLTLVETDQRPYAEDMHAIYLRTQAQLAETALLGAFEAAAIQEGQRYAGSIAVEYDPDRGYN